MPVAGHRVKTLSAAFPNFGAAGLYRMAETGQLNGGWLPQRPLPTVRLRDAREDKRSPSFVFDIGFSQFAVDEGMASAVLVQLNHG